MADKHNGVQTAVPDVPFTVQRPPYVNDGKLRDPGTARATKAATAHAPEGTPGWAEAHTRQTVLQQHCDYFDTDGDGVIWPLDTYRGFYALGFGFALSVLAVFIIHVSFSYATVYGWMPDPFFRLFLDNIHKTKHGSDSGTYDTEGRFVPQKFEDWFSKYAKGKDGVTFMDILDALKGQRLIADPFGWFGAVFEWGSTYIMLWPEDGVMKKEDVRRVYDGSIFVDIASKRANAKKAKAA